MKYLVVLLTMLALVGCTVKEQLVYRNVYIESECPKLTVFDRPVLSKVEIVFEADTAEVTIEQIKEIYINQKKLINVIIAYEELIKVYNK